jgi:hypothetical protein
MALNYDPKDAVQCWPAAEYPGELTKVEEKTSKVKPDGSGGNPMEVWTFRAFNNSAEQLISDYVVIPAATFKIKQLAEALGRKADFEAGNFQAEDHIGAGVILDLVIDKQDGFDDKNKIRKIKSAGASAPAPATPAARLSGGGRPRQPVQSAIGEDHFSVDDVPFFWRDPRTAP